jgi:hypothetical protein
LFAATLAPALHADPAGTSVHLQALPIYVQRLFLPVIPAAQNALRIDTLQIDRVLDVPQGFEIQAQNGTLAVYAQPGDHSGYARVAAGDRELTLTLVTAVPYDAMKDGLLDGYRVGEYNAAPLKGLESYERPKGFIHLDEASAALQVSDHYRLGNFQCKLDGPAKFVVLRTEALLKLEILQHELETQQGLKFDRFTVMSGYRTPYYNAKIGNETDYSRHLYGDAMDVYIDTNADGRMDDINRDGRIDAGDARFILRIAEQIDQSAEWGWLKGGAGVYQSNAAHGPFLHVDARGYVARWGATAELASTRGSVRPA